MTFRAPTPVLVVVLALAIAVLLALGTWQAFRFHAKQGLAAERTARTLAAPTDVNTLLGSSRDDVDWRQVAARGTWDNERTMLVANRVRFDVLGSEAVTPLLLAAGGPAVLVNRGWFPRQRQQEILAQLAAETTGRVDGVAIAAGDGNAFQTDSGAWSSLDPATMTRGLPYAVLPWAVLQGRLVGDFQFDGGRLPLQQYRGYQNTTPHLEYAATWFGLAIALFTIAVIRFFIAPRRALQAARRAPPAPEL